MQHRSTRFHAAAVGAAALAVAGLAATTARAVPAPTATTAEPTLGTLIAGEESYVDGAHVWTDYAYDDRGPNSNGVAGGDATYPSAPHPGNTADLIQLQLGQDGDGRLTVAAVLETLVGGHDSLVGVGFDTDGDRSTGAPAVEGGLWGSPENPLGLEELVLLPTTGQGRHLRYLDGAWTTNSTFTPTVELEANVVRATVSSLQPGKATWHAVGLAGPMEGQAAWADGTRPIHDLAFVRAEDPTNEVVVALREQVPQLGFVPYQDKNQADVLAGRLPATAAVAAVRFGTSDDREPVTRQGFNAFLYRSSAHLPQEGVQAEPLQYNGRWMPYAVWIPANLPASRPLLMFLHGANQYQNVNLVHFNNPQSIGIPSPYNVPAITIFPNGRTTGWSTPLADLDALEAMDDAIARPALKIDPERVVVTGVSSGGMGTFHLASWYPDRFTGAYSLVGGGTSHLENLTNVPFRASNGLLDPLVNAKTWRDSADALAAAGTVDYRIVLVHNRSHDGPLAEGNCYYLDLVSRPRVVDPARVRYRTPMPRPTPPGMVEALPVGAYWVDAMERRDPDAPAVVDLESQAKPARVAGEPIRQVKENAVSTADFCGPHPTMRNGSNWSTEGLAYREEPRPNPQNALVGAVENLASASVDVARAGLDAAEPVTLTLTSDGDGTLGLVGRWRGTLRILVDGAEVARRRAADGVVTIPVAQGEHTYVVVPV